MRAAVAGALAVSLLLAASAAADPPPEKRSVESSQGQSFADLEQLQLPADRVIYDSHPRTPTTPGWPASNEFDWANAPIDRDAAKIVAGVANNNVWDIGLRRGAEHLMIGDIDERVLKVHEYVLKPLVLAAETPSEFVSMLAGIPLPESLKDAPVEAAFRHIDRELSRYEQTTRFGEVPPERARFAQELKQRIEQHDQLDTRHADLVERHLTAISGLDKESRMVRNLGAMLGRRIDLYEGGLAPFGSRDDLYSHFKLRYDPEELRQNGATEEQLKDPMFSVLSSQRSFEWIKERFARDQVHYFVADAFDPRAAEAIAAKAKRLGGKIDGFFLSNVPDFVTRSNPARSRELLTRFSRNLASANGPFTLYHTGRTGPPHRFEIFDVDHGGGMSLRGGTSRGRRRESPRPFSGRPTAD